MTDMTYRIVVGTDLSEMADLALDKAFDLASREPAAEVHVIFAVTHLGDYVEMDLPNAPIYAFPLEEAQEKLEAHVAARLAAWQERTKKTFSRAATYVSTDFPAMAIAQLGSDLDAEMIVVGTHGRQGFKRFVLGSVAESVVRLAHTPVLVVRPKWEQAPIPKIEPPCPRCVEVRNATNNETYWCEEHSRKHGRRHTYRFRERISKDGSLPMFMGMPR